jgi:DNA-binding PadR family transcriptional regulator
MLFSENLKEVRMGKGFLTYSTAVILQAVANGYLYGFDIIDITGLPGGTVYPALRRLEEAGHLTSKWEKQSVAQEALRPPRRYYELTRSGREALAEAVKRYRLLGQAQPDKAREPKPSPA